jgi:hypothetical protein
MANLTKGGFRPWGTFSGGSGVFPGTKTVEVASGYGTNIFSGDILTTVSDGTVVQAAAGDAAKFIGVALGFSYVISGRREPMPYLPASTTFTPSTVGSPTASYIDMMPLTADLILEVDGNAAAPTPTPAGVIGLIGENCDLTAATSGDTTTGMSGMCLDLSTHNTTTKCFRIIGVSEYPHFTLNDVTLTRCKFLVVLNQGFYPPYTTSGI